MSVAIIGLLLQLATLTGVIWIVRYLRRLDRAAGEKIDQTQERTEILTQVSEGASPRAADYKHLTEGKSIWHSNSRRTVRGGKKK